MIPCTQPSPRWVGVPALTVPAQPRRSPGNTWSGCRGRAAHTPRPHLPGRAEPSPDAARGSPDAARAAARLSHPCCRFPLQMGTRPRGPNRDSALKRCGNLNGFSSFPVCEGWPSLSPWCGPGTWVCNTPCRGPSPQQQPNPLNLFGAGWTVGAWRFGWWFLLPSRLWWRTTSCQCHQTSPLGRRSARPRPAASGTLELRCSSVHPAEEELCFPRVTVSQAQRGCAWVAMGVKLGFSWFVHVVRMGFPPLHPAYLDGRRFQQPRGGRQRLESTRSNLPWWEPEMRVKTASLHIRDRLTKAREVSRQRTLEQAERAETRHCGAVLGRRSLFCGQGHPASVF